MSTNDDPAVPVKNLETMLQQTLGLQLEVQHIQWKYLTDPGENFGSLILAVDVTVIRDFNPAMLNLVVKLPPPSEYLQKLFDSPLTFKKELNFYKNLAPAFLNLQRQLGCHQDELIALVPQYYGGRLSLSDSVEFDDQAAIVLENLNYSGYSTQDRILGLDRQHSELAVKELAKLHAITIGLREHEPELFDEIIEPALEPHINDVTRESVLGMVRKAQADLKAMPEAATYLDRIESTLRLDYEITDEPRQEKGAWATLVHNDFWVNNMMFRYDIKGKPVEMKMVDFQLCVVDCGLKDLIFFLLSSPQKEIIDKNFDQMIELYYKSFIDAVRSLKLNDKIFSRSRFDELLNYYAPATFGKCIMMMQVIKAKRGTAKEMENMDGFKSLDGGSLYKEKLLHIVKVFDRKGWLLT